MADLHGARVLVVANEQVGERMAGPAIRAINLARQLAARDARVTIAMPAAPTGVNGLLEGLRCETFGMPSSRRFRELADAHDVVVTQPQRVDVAWGLSRARARIVYDLYVPSFVERIAQLATEPGDETFKRRLLERDRREYAAAIQLGDAFICASERQRDHWLGALGQAGRLELDLLARDARADTLCGVVAFGVPDEPPVELVEPPLRGTVVPEDSIIALWTGGLWNWFDPVAVVDALARARELEPRLRLVVMGVRHPEAAWEEQDAARAMRERADELGLLEDGGVVLLEGWVPYAERDRYLLDADFAVSAHHDSLETRLSFRTRFLDQLWCGLPTITTEGGELTERMVEAGAARATRAGDGDDLLAAMLELAHDHDRRAQMSQAARGLACAYRWQQTTEPLAQIVASLAAPDVVARRTSRADVELTSYMRLLVQIRAQAKGVRSLASAARSAAGRR